MSETGNAATDASLEARELLNSETVRDHTAGRKVIAHLLDVVDDRHHLLRHLQDLEGAFGKLLTHDRAALKAQLQGAIGPEGKKFLKSALAECAGGLLCELLKLILL